MSKNRPRLLLTTSIENFSDVMEEMKCLNLDHYNQLSDHKNHGFPLLPNYNAYLHMEANAEILYIALRCLGKLVGYYIGFIGYSPHYSTCLQIKQDIIFVGREALGQNGGDLLLKELEVQIKKRGIRASIIGFKDAHKRFMPKLLEDNGYKPFEVYYIKWFD